MIRGVINVESWFVVRLGNSLCLRGFTSNHPCWPGGDLKLITTSRILGRVGNDVITRSGSVYRLVKPGGPENIGDLIGRLEELGAVSKREVLPPG